MVYAIVRLSFADYAKWKETFEQAGPLRKQYGSRGVRFFRPLDRPQEVVILGQYEDLEKARRLFQSQEFRDATRKAGVTGTPEVTLAEGGGELPA